MKIEDLVTLLNNRLREFKLSRDYAKMSGDLERMNDADKEVLALEDTLYKLNLLVDTTKSAAVKEAVLAEVITDGSVAVLGEYDITPYATDPLHEEKIMNLLSKMGVMDTAEKIDDYIKGKYLSSPVTGEMVISATLAYAVDTRLLMAIMEQDSRFGTAGLAVRTLNPGNVGNDDGGNTRTYGSWQEGVTAVAEWLNRHRGKTDITPEPEPEPEPTPEPEPAPDSTGSPQAEPEPLVPSEVEGEPTPEPEEEVSNTPDAPAEPEAGTPTESVGAEPTPEPEPEAEPEPEPTPETVTTIAN